MPLTFTLETGLTVHVRLTDQSDGTSYAFDLTERSGTGAGLYYIDDGDLEAGELPAGIFTARAFDGLAEDDDETNGYMGASTRFQFDGEAEVVPAAPNDVNITIGGSTVFTNDND